jgi:hypothetical protein
MMDVTVHQLLCFDAVVTEGSFQAAAAKMRRAQPSVSLAVKNLEGQLRLSLLDRSGYRVSLTEAGRSFHERTRVLLHELQALKTHATQLAMGDESELRVVIGDLCPLRETLALLRRFFDGCPGTRLHLHFEALPGRGNGCSTTRRISSCITSTRAIRASNSSICSRCGSCRSWRPVSCGFRSRARSRRNGCATTCNA